MHNPFKKKAFNPFNHSPSYQEYSKDLWGGCCKITKRIFALLRHKLLYIIVVPILAVWFISTTIMQRVENRPNKFFYNEINAFLNNTAPEQWLNVFYPLTIDDLESYPVILFFWQLDDIHSLSKLGYMGQIYNEYKNKAIIISVVSSKNVQLYADKDKLVGKMREIIAFYNIHYPIIIENWQQNLQKLILDNSKQLIDKSVDMEQQQTSLISTVGLQDKQIPQVILFDHRGNLVYTTKKEFDFSDLNSQIMHLVSNEESIKAAKNAQASLILPVFQEQINKPSYLLSYPSSISYIDNYSKINAPAVVIADTGHDRILITSLNGEILDEIGSGRKTKLDGDYQNAGFYRPQGVEYYQQKIYVADTGNNSIRVIDLLNKEVSTLLTAPTINFAQDIKIIADDDEKILWIANSGKHELLAYNLDTNKLLKPVKLDKAIIPYKMAKYAGSLYVIDAATNNLLEIKDNEVVDTLELNFKQLDKGKLAVSNYSNTQIHKLTADGDVNGGELPEENSELPKMPENINASSLAGIYVDDTGIYLSDYENGNIYKITINKQKEQISYNGSLYYNSDKDGLCQTPAALTGVLDRLYVVDLDHDRIVILNRNSNKHELLNVVPTRISNRDIIGDYLHNVSKLPIINVSANTNLKLILALPEGWKINESAPSFLEIYAIQNTEADLIRNYNFVEIATSNKTLTLPVLESDKEYYLRGTIYYCKAQGNSLCLFRSFSQRIIPTNNEQLSGTSIELDFVVQ